MDKKSRATHQPLPNPIQQTHFARVNDKFFPWWIPFSELSEHLICSCFWSKKWFIYFAHFSHCFYAFFVFIFDAVQSKRVWPSDREREIPTKHVEIGSREKFVLLNSSPIKKVDDEKFLGKIKLLPRVLAIAAIFSMLSYNISNLNSSSFTKAFL